MKKIVALIIIILPVNSGFTQCFVRSKIPDSIRNNVNQFNNRIRERDGNLTKQLFLNAFFDTTYLDNLNSSIKFDSCQFNGKTYFNNLYFDSLVSFDGVHFNGRVEFSELTLNEGFSFNKAIFKKNLHFHDISFENSQGIFSFNASKLPDTIFFDWNKRIPEVDFTEADFSDNKIHYISLIRSDISKIKIDYDHFALHFKNCVDKDIPNLEKIPVYEELLKNFKDRGQLHDYQKLDEEYINYKWSLKKLKLPGIPPLSLHFLGSISKLWWDYGYEKELVFFWTLIFISIFTLITFLKLNYLNREVYPINTIPIVPIFNNNINFSIKQVFHNWLGKNLKIYNFQKLLTRVWYSFLYTSSIFFRLSLKINDINFTKRWALYLILVYLVGLICLAYMANYVLQK